MKHTAAHTDPFSCIHAHCLDAFVCIRQAIHGQEPWPLLEEAVSFYEEVWRNGGRLMDYYYALPGMSCVAVGGDWRAALPLTAAWILYDLASDIFDDLQDQDKPEAPWLHWRSDHAMLVGLGALFAAARCQAALDLDGQACREIQEAIAEAGLLAAQGQAVATAATEPTAYFRRIVANTGMVFAAIAWSGARIHSNKPRELEALHRYGLALGVMLQLRDDCIDLTSGDDVNDFVRGIRTLPLLYALNLEERSNHPRLNTLFAEGDGWNADSRQDVLQALNEVGAWSFMQAMMRAYQQKAIQALTPLPSEQTQLLRAYIEDILPVDDNR